VSRVLIRSTPFIRAAKRLIRKDARATAELKKVLHLLAEDPFHPLLRTHKLHGKLEGSWACKVGYDLRIVFEFVEYEGSEAILLQTVGSHEEVY
jgi:addiction module RelE/StbE family toxin